VGGLCDHDSSFFWDGFINTFPSFSETSDVVDTMCYYVLRVWNTLDQQTTQNSSGQEHNEHESNESLLTRKRQALIFNQPSAA